MAKADLGTKRLCPNCGARYYDLNRSPIICPRCGTHFEVPAASRGRAAPAPAVVEEEVEAETETAEMISLEEADEEAAGGAEEVEDSEDIEAGAEPEEDVFLEEEEEEGDDVTNIIGDVDEEER